MNTLGMLGEELIESHLIERGHRILARNLRIRKDEIDIVSFKDGVHYIVEVKCTRLDTGVSPGQQMTHNKRHTFERAAMRYYRKFRVKRFKLLFAEVVLDEGDHTISIAVTRYS